MNLSELFEELKIYSIRYNYHSIYLEYGKGKWRVDMQDSYGNTIEGSDADTPEEAAKNTIALMEKVNNDRT